MPEAMSVPFRNPAPHSSVNLDVDVTTNRISRCWKREAYLCKLDFHFFATSQSALDLHARQKKFLSVTRVFAPRIDTTIPVDEAIYYRSSHCVGDVEICVHDHHRPKPLNPQLFFFSCPPPSKARGRHRLQFFGVPTPRATVAERRTDGQKQQIQG